MIFAAPGRTVEKRGGAGEGKKNRMGESKGEKWDVLVD